MAAPVDPTYPLLPTASFLSSALLALMFIGRLIRHTRSLGVTFLCFWLCLENAANGANFVIWSDNAEIKLYTYCDIGALLLISERYSLTLITAVSRLQVIAIIVKPMATFIITRQLYLIVNVQTIQYSLAKV